jgi:PhnB protein
MAPTAKPKPIPDAYRRVTPCLVVQGGAKAIEFYAEVFQATERMRFPGPRGTVAHAEIQIGDSVVIIEDESPERGSKAPPPGGVDGSPSFLFIYVEDVDAVVARAVELGATLQRPPQDQFYGDRDGGTVALSDYPIRLPPLRRSRRQDHRHGRVVRALLGALP